MLRKSDRSDKVKIFKNIWFFTVGLHLRNVDNARRKLEKTFFSGSVTDMHEKACLDPLWASIWDPFGQPKLMPNRSGGLPDGHGIWDLGFEEWSSRGGTGLAP